MPLAEIVERRATRTTSLQRIVRFGGDKKGDGASVCEVMHPLMHVSARLRRPPHGDPAIAQLRSPVAQIKFKHVAKEDAVSRRCRVSAVKVSQLCTAGDSDRVSQRFITLPLSQPLYRCS